MAATFQVDVYGQIDETYEGLTADEARRLIAERRAAGDKVNVMNEQTGAWVIQDR